MKLEWELLLYIVFGFFTTLLNIVVYLFFTEFCGVNYIISNIFAWFLSVLFAYITNRIWVFESTNTNIIEEISLFFAGRLFSGIIDTSLMGIIH